MPPVPKRLDWNLANQKRNGRKSWQSPSCQVLTAGEKLREALEGRNAANIDHLRRTGQMFKTCMQTMQMHLASLASLGPVGKTATKGHHYACAACARTHPTAKFTVKGQPSTDPAPWRRLHVVITCPDPRAFCILHGANDCVFGLFKKYKIP